MAFFWILLCLAGWAVAILLVLVLLRMAGHQDRIARRAELEISQNSGSPAPDRGSRAESDDIRRMPVDGPSRG